MDPLLRNRWCPVIIGCLLVLHGIKGQQNPIFGTPSPGGGSSSTGTNYFYFDSKSDCNQGVRNLFGAKGTLLGTNSSAHKDGVTTCTIILKSEGAFDGTVLDINVEALNILDCSTMVSIYDGEGAKILLNSYDCRSSQNPNRRQFTTAGNVATFIMNRPSPDNYNFDVKITVDPISSGPVVPTDGSGLTDYTKFPQKYIVIMIAAIYFFVFLICFCVVVCKNRNYNGANAKWEIHELSNIKTGINFDSKSQFDKPVSTVEGMKNRELGSQYSRSTAQHTLRKATPPSEDGDSGVYYNEETFQRKKLMNKERENVSNRVVANTAFKDYDDNFKEKAVAPSRQAARNRQPPPYSEIISDSESAHSSDEESEASSNSTSVRKKSRSSDEDRSDRSSERSSVRTRSSRSTARSRSTRSATPSETDSEEDSDDGHQARGHRGKQKKSHQHPIRTPRSSQPHQPRPMQQPPPPPVYGGYPPPGQFVPMMVAPPHYQPMMQGYPPPHFSAQAQSSAAPPPQGPQVQPTDIPVYSYLVQRGYRPIDDLNASNASTESQRSGARKQEEPDLRLETGVEYMRR